MTADATQPPTPPGPAQAGAAWPLGVLALLVMIPVTMPVTVLRGLVQERFEVGEFATSTFMSINMVGAVLAAPLIGALCDRFGRRKPVLVAALLLDSLLLTGLTLQLSFPLFLLCRLLEGVTHIAALSALLTLASDMGQGRGRGRTMGIVGAGITLGVALGAPAGGILGRDNPFLPIWIGGAILLLASGWAQLLTHDIPGTLRSASLQRLVQTLRQNRAVALPYLFALVDRFTVGFFTTTFPLYMRRIHEAPPDRIGLLLAGFLIPFSLLSYPFGRLAERWSLRGMVLLGSGVYGVLVFSLTEWSGDSLVLLMPLLGIASAVMFVPSLLMVTDYTPGSIRSTALGGFNAAGSLGFIIGPLVGGWVSESIAATDGWEAGYTAAFRVAGVAEILCVLVSLPLFWHLRKTRSRGVG